MGPSLEYFDGRIHALGNSKYSGRNPKKRKRGQEYGTEQYSSNSEKMLLEQTLLQSDILRIIFGFLKQKELRIFAQFVSFISISSTVMDFVASYRNWERKCGRKYLILGPMNSWCS